MDNTDVGLRAAIRALSDVVTPVVAAAHSQARDQLRLSIDYLTFVVARLDDLPRRDRFETTHHLEMAKAVRAALDTTQAPRLDAAIELGQRALTMVGPATAEVREANAALSSAISAAVQEAGSMDETARRAVERCVLQASLHRIAFERAWYMPLGLDPDPHDVQPLAEFFSPLR